MSDPKSYTIRFTTEDYALLDTLCQQFGLKRPDALRRALRLAYTARPLLREGIFSPVGAQDTFAVKLGGRHDVE